MTTCRNLIFLLGDQLSRDLSSLKGADPEKDVVLMCEVHDETTYVRHHKKKLAFILSAMRHFAADLREEGFAVDYVKLDDERNSGSLAGELVRAVERWRPARVILTEASERRVLADQKAWQDETGVPVEIRPDTRFLCSIEEFRTWADGRKTFTMEYFYRDMRRKTGLLMDGETPSGGRWNFDAENRKPASDDLFRTPREAIRPDAVTCEVLELVESRFPGHMGTTKGFAYAVTRGDAERLADAFMKDFLPAFGETQDAMLKGDPFLNHSLLSPYINVGLLDPLVLCRSAERAFFEGRAPINAVEGFIRQIIGWREYVRGIYWYAGADYEHSNFLEANRPLPDFFWTGRTKMACLAAVIGETIDNAYAHHIQRLMVTGNFALLAAIDPHALHVWYLEVYADAFEWVEMPNVIGMSQFADGGLLGSKPYAASGAYLSRMSDYCKGCSYDVTVKTGPRACPFNALYWDFLARNRDRLDGNRRLAQAYATWKRMSGEKQAAYLESAAAFLGKLDAGGDV